MAEIPQESFDAARNALGRTDSGPDPDAIARARADLAGADLGPTPGPTRKNAFSRAVGATREHASKLGRHGAFIITHPQILPKLIGKGAKTYSESLLHPAVTLKNLVRHPGEVFTLKELAYYGGAAEGFLDTMLIYNTLPPGVAGLARAGLSLAISQAPNAAFAVYRYYEKSKIREQYPDAATRVEKLKENEAKFGHAKVYLEAFARGRTLGSTARFLTVSGATETLLHASGINVDAGSLLRKVTGLGVDEQTVKLAAQADQIIQGSDFQDVFGQISETNEFKIKLIGFESDAWNKANTSFDLSGLSNEELRSIGSSAIEKVRNNTKEWVLAKFKEGAKQALMADPSLSPAEAAEAGKQYAYNSIEALQNNQEEFVKWSQKNHDLINQAIQEGRATQTARLAASTATPTAAPAETATSTATPATPESTPESSAPPAKPEPAAQPRPAQPPAGSNPAAAVPSAGELHEAARLADKDVLKDALKPWGSPESVELFLKETAGNAVYKHLSQIQQATTEAAAILGVDPDKLSLKMLKAVNYQVQQEAQSQASESMADYIYQRKDLPNTFVLPNISVVEQALNSEESHQQLVNEAKKALIAETLKEQTSSIIKENSGIVREMVSKAIEDNPSLGNSTQVSAATYNEMVAHLQDQIREQAISLNEQLSAAARQPGVELDELAHQTRQEFSDSLLDSSTSLHKKLADGARNLVNGYLIEQKNYSELVTAAIRTGDKLNPDLAFMVDLKPGDTVSQVLANKGHFDFTTWGPERADVLAAHAIVNYDLLLNRFGLSEKELFALWKLARDGDIVSLQKLKDILHLIPADKHFIVLKIGGIDKINQIPAVIASAR